MKTLIRKVKLGKENFSGWFYENAIQKKGRRIWVSYQGNGRIFVAIRESDE